MKLLSKTSHSEPLRWFKNRYIRAFLLAVLIVVMLRVKTSDQAVNFADSNDLLLAAESMGLAHPPGYPLLILILAGLKFCFQTTPLPLVSGWFTAILMGTATGLLFLTIREIARIKRLSHFHDVYALIPALLWVTTPLNWMLGTVVEVMPLGIVLIVLGTFFWCKKKYGLAGFSSTLASLHHPLLMILSVIIWTSPFFSSRFPKKQLYRLGFGMGMAVLVTVMSYGILAHTASRYSWEVPQSLGAWWQMFNRQSYTESGSAIEMFNQETRVSTGLTSVSLWMRWWINDQWGWVLGGFSLFGLGRFVLTRQWRWFGLSLGTLFIYGPGVAYYIKHPSVLGLAETAVWWGVALRERMFYVFFLILPLIAFEGIYLVFSSIRRHTWIQYIALSLLLTFCGWRVYVQSIQRSMDTGANAAAVYSKQILTSLPERAIMVTQTDEVFNFLYTQLALDIRPDVSIVPVGMVLEPSKWRDNALAANGFTDNQQAFVADVVTTGLRQQRPVYLYAVDASILSYLGLEGDPFYSVPEGLLLRVQREPPTMLPSADYGVSVQLAPIKTQVSDNWFRGFRTHLATLHTQQTYYLARLGFSDQALWHANIAKKLFYESASKNVVDSTLQVGTARFESGKSYWWYKRLSIEEWQQRAEQARQTGNHDEALFFSSRILLLRSVLGR